MLTSLRISGFALIDELELQLGPGLTVITGETGAGKSIIVEALGLLRGGRASAEAIRAGCEEARVEALIDLPAGSAIRRRLDADGRELHEGLLVRRVVSRSGRGRVHLGGGLSTAGELTATVGGLIEITSQHDQQSLTDPASQLDILDAFAGNAALRDAMAGAYRAWHQADLELQTFTADARTRSEREDLLRFQLQEIEGARLVAGEDEALRAERERLRGAERFHAAAAGGEAALYSDEGAVAGKLAALARELGGLAVLDPALAPLVERLAGAQAVVEDVASDLGRYADRSKADPERLAEVEERLFLLGRLTRKHGGTLDAVIERQRQMSEELRAIGSYDQELEQRRAARDAAEQQARETAEALSASRARAARTLARKVESEMDELGLRSSRLPVMVESRVELGGTGRDTVRFLFAPNPGEEPRPLARIASGGELSRVMLALKQALARSDQVLTYVFDEVDAGVGGGTGEIIGRKLRRIAADRQVLTITHLPQIAAFADHHLRVVKTPSKGRTVVEVQVLDTEQRTRELARMLAGARPSDEAMAHAGEMLTRARKTAKAGKN